MSLCRFLLLNAAFLLIDVMFTCLSEILCFSENIYYKGQTNKKIIIFNLKNCYKLIGTALVNLYL